MEIAAIPTTYKGIELKSRMEAQCAVLFDKLGFAWEYESFSLMLPSGISYIPDFWLPRFSLIVECRGYHSPRGDAQIEQFAQFIREGGLAPGSLTTDYATIGPEYCLYSRAYFEYKACLTFERCLNCGRSGIADQFPICGSCGSKSLAWYLLNVEDGKLLLNGLPIEQVQF